MDLCQYMYPFWIMAWRFYQYDLPNLVVLGMLLPWKNMEKGLNTINKKKSLVIILLNALTNFDCVRGLEMTLASGCRRTFTTVFQ